MSPKKKLKTSTVKQTGDDKIKFGIQHFFYRRASQSLNTNPNSQFPSAAPEIPEPPPHKDKDDADVTPESTKSASHLAFSPRMEFNISWEALREELAVQQTAMTLEEVMERMRNVLSLTDVTPKNPEAVIFVAATDDAYIPKQSVLELQKAWPGSKVRWVTDGHVSSILLHHGEFRKAIVDALDRVEWKESSL